MFQADTAAIVVLKRHNTTQVNKQGSTSPEHLKCKDFFFRSKPPSNMISVLGDQTKHSRFREELSHTGPFVFINALYSLKII